MSSEQPPDRPGVVIFPPLIGLAVLVFGLLLDYLLPLGGVSSLAFLPRVVIGACLLAIGISLAARARATFVVSGTNVNPMQPSLTVVASGIFAHVRNPMYEGGTIGLIGLALIFGSDWMLLLLIPALLILHFGVVLREERYLERKFGEPYRRYLRDAPRYGWKF
jgi:protein-S-isoprenylcysteine O-methyltransferase Ste14